MNNYHIHIGGADIYYRTTGNGYPVVLLHGFGEDGAIWDQQAEALKEYRLIIPDIPGSGKSAMLSNPGVGLEDYAAAIKSIIGKEGINQCIMIGHSMGGYITLAFEEKYPSVLSSFGLFHSSAYKDDTEKIATRMKAIDFIRKNGAMPFLKTSTPNLFYDPAISSEQIDTLLEKGKGFKDEALVQYYQAMISRPDRTEVLKSTPKPVFFIIGKHDKAVPFEHSLRQCHVPSQTFVHILRNSGHMGMLEETTKTNECLRNILHAIVVN